MNTMTDTERCILYPYICILVYNGLKRKDTLYIVESTETTVYRVFFLRGNKMKIIIHDCDESYDAGFKNISDEVIWANGRYAPCQGCFECWTKNPATCRMKDSLHEICRLIGQADDLIIITKNCYGGYDTPVKNILDRAIGMSTPMSSYRGGQMHHTLRYGKKGRLTIVVYGDINENEKKTWELMAERNRINYGYENKELMIIDSINELEGMDI